MEWIYPINRYSQCSSIQSSMKAKLSFSLHRNKAEENHDDISPKPDAEMVKYRELLVKAEQDSQDQYDKAILSLSGSALGLTFTFIDKVVALDHAEFKGCLLLAWSLWGISILATLISFLSSRHAIRNAIVQVDAGTIHDQKPGGWWDSATSWLNIISAFSFTVGLIFLIIFVSENFHR